MRTHCDRITCATAAMGSWAAAAPPSFAAIVIGMTAATGGLSQIGVSLGGARSGGVPVYAAAFVPPQSLLARGGRDRTTTLSLLTRPKGAEEKETSSNPRRRRKSFKKEVNGTSKSRTADADVDSEDQQRQRRHMGDASTTVLDVSGAPAAEGAGDGVGPELDRSEAFGLSASGANLTKEIVEQFATNVTDLVEGMNRQMTDGTREILGNMTDTFEAHLETLVDGSSGGSDFDLRQYIVDLNAEMQRAQERELDRQVMEFERMFVRPLEDFAFSDAKLLRPVDAETSAFDEEDVEKRAKRKEDRNSLIIAGENSTLAETSRRLRTSEIVRNINVAPLYYSITLLMRWMNKVSAPPLTLLSFFKGFSALFGSPAKLRKKRGQPSYEEFMKDADSMQAGWKRTGDIASKGPIGRKWAIMQRSAEIWFYFSSFYLKERRMLNKLNSGRWTQEQFSEERSKLGAEVTQNLLKLGPTFIKVCIKFSTPVSHHSIPLEPSLSITGCSCISRNMFPYSQFLLHLL